MESGDFSYQGVAAADALEVIGASAGRAASESTAEERESGNSWSMSIDSDRLVIQSQSRERRASVDFDVRGPELMDLNIDLSDGSATVDEAEGAHAIRANYVTSRHLRGNASIEANSGMNVDIWPYEDGVISLSAVSGNVRLALPYGGPYDIQVWGSPSYAMYITDLGFTRQSASDGYFAAQSGAATVRIDVSVSGGEFTLDPSF